jgi:hypothetical protein
MIYPVRFELYSLVLSGGRGGAMNMKNAAGITALATLCLLGQAGACLAGEPVYTKYNIHVQLEVSRKGEKSYQASYSGWVDPGKGHAIVPPNTKVVYEPATGPVWTKFSQNRGFRLVLTDPAAIGLQASTISFEYNPKNMAMTEEEYLKLITSPTPVSLDGLSGKDLEGVRSGRVLDGMTKRGVMTALGYPAAHRTPNPDTDGVWTYWRDRFKTVDVYFDSLGKVQRLSN